MFFENISFHIASAVIVLLLTLGLVNWWNRVRKLPPGPWGLPLLGYYPLISGKLSDNFTHLAEKYGDIFSFRTIGGKLVVVFNGPKVIREVLVTRSEEFNGRPTEGNVLDWITGGLGLIQEEGAPWKEQRRFFLQTVKNYGFGKLKLEEAIHEEVRTLLQVMRRTRGRPTDFDVDVAYACNSVISRVLFALKHPREGDFFPKLVDAFHHLLGNFSSHRYLLVGSYFRYLAIKYFPWSHKIREAREFVTKVYSDIIDEHIRKYDPNNLKDYVDSYLYELEKIKQGTKNINYFTKDRLAAISMNMTMEGTETITYAILCLLQEAARHPQELSLVQEELDSVVGRKRLPSWLDRHRMPYLEAFIQELNRKGQSFYTTAQYSNYEETSIGGYVIPKRSILFANLWTINNDPENFPDPHTFDVNRFLRKEGEKIKTEGPYPFGLGKRDCAGKSLATMEVFLILAAVFQHFHLAPGSEPATLRVFDREKDHRHLPQ